MPVCNRCSTVIQKLRPQQTPLVQTNPVKVELPFLQPTEYANCWICHKFSQWLETDDLLLFEEWRRRPLLVTFFVYGCPLLIKGPPGFLLPLFIGIRPESYDDEDFCDIELNFIPHEGNANNR
jgi:hypothetical protein